VFAGTPSRHIGVWAVPSGGSIEQGPESIDISLVEVKSFISYTREASLGDWGTLHCTSWNPTPDSVRLDEGRWVLAAACRDEARVRAEPFDAIELDLGVLWADVAAA
jgi:hypothetical protein